MGLVVNHDPAWMEHGYVFRLDGVHERRCFRDLQERAGRSERVIHCRPTDEIDPLATLIFEQLTTQIAGALAQPFRGPGRNLHEPVTIHIWFEPVDDDLELPIHLRLHLLSLRSRPASPVRTESEAERRVNPMSASR